MVIKKVKLMKCGHAPNGTMADSGKPVCVICWGNNPDAEVPMPDDGLPDLKGRMAVCTQCKKSPATTAPSNFKLPFFEHRPDNKRDAYYCGCWGWD